MTITPTEEQAHAVEIAKSGVSMKIEALAGTGKTSTLELIARAKGTQTGAYLVFNRALADEAAERFPKNVKCNTAHGYAMGAVGREYRHRLGGKRVPSWDLASMLSADPLVVTSFTGRKKRLGAPFIALKAKEAIARFCMTADEKPSRMHVPFIPGLDEEGKYDVNREVAKHVEQYLARYWADIERPSGVLPYEHAHYLKQWQLSGPRISADFLLIDEAQDLNPLMLAIASEQADHAQLIFVGDRFQQIYEWNGAVNAMANAPTEATTYLRQSFRFGDAVAEVANEALRQLGAEVEIVGNPARTSMLCVLREPNAYLARTNAGAVATAIAEMQDGKKVALVGGTNEVISFARAAKKLMDGGRTEHAELACFDTWNDVLDAVNVTKEASELSTLVKLVEEHTPERLISELGKMNADEKSADLVVSTAHKSKGREWGMVALGGDFPDPAGDKPITPEEIRLAYVAATRAKTHLDPYACALLRTPAVTR